MKVWSPWVLSKQSLQILICLLLVQTPPSQSTRAGGHKCPCPQHRGRHRCLSLVPLSGIGCWVLIFPGYGGPHPTGTATGGWALPGSHVLTVQDYHDSQHPWGSRAVPSSPDLGQAKRRRHHPNGSSVLPSPCLHGVDCPTNSQVLCLRVHSGWRECWERAAGWGVVAEASGEECSWWLRLSLRPLAAWWRAGYHDGPQITWATRVLGKTLRDPLLPHPPYSKVERTTCAPVAGTRALRFHSAATTCVRVLPGAGAYHLPRPHPWRSGTLLSTKLQSLGNPYESPPRVS